MENTSFRILSIMSWTTLWEERGGNLVDFLLFFRLCFLTGKVGHWRRFGESSGVGRRNFLLIDGGAGCDNELSEFEGERFELGNSLCLLERGGLGLKFGGGMLELKEGI